MFFKQLMTQVSCVTFFFDTINTSIYFMIEIILNCLKIPGNFSFRIVYEQMNPHPQLFYLSKQYNIITRDFTHYVLRIYCYDNLTISWFNLNRYFLSVLILIFFISVPVKLIFFKYILHIKISTYLYILLKFLVLLNLFFALLSFNTLFIFNAIYVIE